MLKLVMHSRAFENSLSATKSKISRFMVRCIYFQGRRNHLLAADVLRLSVMLLGNSLDTHHFPVRTLKQVLFPDDSTEGGVNQVCSNSYIV